MKQGGWYATALICLNGHIVTSDIETFPEKVVTHCSRCGEKTISKCPSCGAKIRGYHHTPGVVAVYTPELPLFCWNCGSPYPWTVKKQKALNDIIDNIKKLSDSEKEELKKAVDDLVKETPYWRRAALTLKTFANKIGEENWNLMKAIIIDLLTEAVKKELGL